MMDRQSLPLIFPERDYPETPIEDEADYEEALLKVGPIYDWSPPNGEVPAEPLSAFLGVDGIDAGGQDLIRESWIDQGKSLIDEAPKLELKRGFDYPRRKKNQVLCRVQRAIHHHGEAGYEFFPKSYTSYSCHPVSAAEQEGSLATSHDVCIVRSNKCTTLYMKRFFLKRNESNVCWSDILSMEVGSGCDCLYHYKHRIHL